MHYDVFPPGARMALLKCESDHLMHLLQGSLCVTAFLEWYQGPPHGVQSLILLWTPWSSFLLHPFFLPVSALTSTVRTVLAELLALACLTSLTNINLANVFCQTFSWFPEALWWMKWTSVSPSWTHHTLKAHNFVAAPQLPRQPFRFPWVQLPKALNPQKGVSPPPLPMPSCSYPQTGSPVCECQHTLLNENF